jgi:hypothetical protein
MWQQTDWENVLEEKQACRKARRMPQWIIAVLLVIFGLGGCLWAASRPSPQSRKLLSLFQPYETLTISQPNLRATIKALTSLKPARTFRYPASLNKAADIIAAKLKRYGYKPTRQWYTVDGNRYQNVLAHLGPATGPRLVVGAHYDVAGNRPGADDNGSGVAGLLELARLLKTRTPPKKRIDLVFYTLEEPPNFGKSTMGSYVHARSLFRRKIKVEVMLSLEMLGFFRDKNNTQKYPHPLMRWKYPSKGNFLAIVGNEASRKQVLRLYASMRGNRGMPVEQLVAPASLTGVDFSDHRNYWKFGMPAVMLTDTAFFRNPHYHKHSDTPDTLDYKRMGEVVRSTLFALDQWTK